MSELILGDRPEAEEVVYESDLKAGSIVSDSEGDFWVLFDRRDRDGAVWNVVTEGATFPDTLDSYDVLPQTWGPFDVVRAVT